MLFALLINQFVHADASDAHLRSVLLASPDRCSRSSLRLIGVGGAGSGFTPGLRTLFLKPRLRYLLSHEGTYGTGVSFRFVSKETL